MLIPVLALTFVTFIGILIYAWLESEKAAPKMLDEHGHVKQSFQLPSPDRERDSASVRPGAAFSSSACTPRLHASAPNPVFRA